MTTLPILVGEHNPYSTDPRMAMFPWPKNSAGARLQRLVLEMPRHVYLRSFERVDLCQGTKWKLPEAREYAKHLYARAAGGATLVLLGSKVCGAFNVPFVPFKVTAHGPGKLVVLPHPSGLCRTWQEPGAFERARAVLREAGVLAPLSEAEATP